MRHFTITTKHHYCGVAHQQKLYDVNTFDVYFQPEIKHKDGSVTEMSLCIQTRMFRIEIVDIKQVREALREIERELPYIMSTEGFKHSI